MYVAFFVLMSCFGPDLVDTGERPKPEEAKPAPPPKPAEPEKPKKKVAYTEPPPLMLDPKQCDEVKPGPAPTNGCITAEIVCGETVVGHTVGGGKWFDTDWYERNFCWPRTHDHDDGGERVYRFRFPPGGDGLQHARAYLDSPCADLDVMVFQSAADTCADTKTPECDASRRDGRRREVVDMATDDTVNWRDWLIVVEGVDDEEGAFALTVKCGPFWMGHPID